MTDITLLGSAIYSQWRYFNHWAYTGAEILEPQNRAWFILALSRLAMLSGDNPFIFQGTLKKMRVISNNICYGPMPEPNEEVEQHLTINNEGRVWFSGYNFGCGGERYEKARSKNFKIDKDATDKLFDAIAAYFGNEYMEVFATDIGDWVMELTNSEGMTYKFRGSLCADFDYEGKDLSDLVRDTVGMAAVCMFVGSSNMTIKQALDALFHNGTPAHERIIWNIRIPRVLAAMIAGAGLSVSGLIMQTTLNNSMASPSTLGVSNAAVFGANLSIIAFAGGFLSTGNNLTNYTVGANPYSTSLMAFFFSTASILLILGLCKIKAFSPNVVVLAGIAVGSVWTAATTILQFYATDVGLSAAVVWSFGDLGRATSRSGTWRECQRDRA